MAPVFGEIGWKCASLGKVILLSVFTELSYQCSLKGVCKFACLGSSDNSGSQTSDDEDEIDSYGRDEDMYGLEHSYASRRRRRQVVESDESGSGNEEDDDDN